MSNHRFRTPLRWMAPVVASTVLIGVGVSTAAQAYTAATTYSPVTTLAVNALGSSSEYVSCSKPGECAMAGIASDSNASYAIVSLQLDGVWSTASQLEFPTTIAGGSPASFPEDVSCSAPGDCVVVGYYIDAAGGGAFIETSTSGIWNTAQPVAIANESQFSITYATLNGVSCPKTGNCTAVGEYTNSNNRSEAMTVQSVHGVWGEAIPTSLDAEIANPANSEFVAVDCPSVGDCAAVGQFGVANEPVRALVATSTNGTWSRAEPVDTSSLVSLTPHSYLTSVSCPHVGDCTATGFYQDLGGYQPMIESSTDNKWTSAKTASLLDYLHTDQQFAPAADVSCAAIGTCVVAGTYQAQYSNQAFTWIEIGGKWRKSIATTTRFTHLPPTILNEYFSVSCPVVSYCVAAGSFDTYQASGAMTDVLTIAGGVATWADAVPATLATTGAAFSDISCAAMGNCTTVGTASIGGASSLTAMQSLSTTYRRPGAPTNVMASTIRGRSAVISWRAPSNNGGAPITSYLVIASPGGAHCTTNRALKCTLVGLNFRSSYSVKVIAANAIYSGSPSKRLRVKTA